ncbi:MAG: hypothetical protein IPH62_19865 [Ignavibacteriae bacterium]|nr:hypothetical protein [Ignavibacteriota bacterium]
MTLEEKFWQLFMIPGDLSDGKEKYKNGIFGFQVSTKGTSSNAARTNTTIWKIWVSQICCRKINEI